MSAWVTEIDNCKQCKCILQKNGTSITHLCNIHREEIKKDDEELRNVLRPPKNSGWVMDW